jgi:hypothetical protein
MALACVAEVAALKVSDLDKRTHVAQGRAWQRWPVSQCHPPADLLTLRVVEGWAQQGTRLVVPGSTGDEADQYPASASHRRRGSAGGGDHQVLERL